MPLDVIRFLFCVVLLNVLVTPVQLRRRSELNRILTDVTSTLKDLETLPSFESDRRETEEEEWEEPRVPVEARLSADVHIGGPVPVEADVRLPPLSPPPKPLHIFSSKEGKVRYDFLSDFSRGYSRSPIKFAKPKPVLLNNSVVWLPENWTIAKTPEEEQRLVELSLANLTQSLLNKTGNLSQFDKLGQDGARAIVLMQKLETLMSTPIPETNKKVVEEAFEALKVYRKIKKSMIDHIMKYSSPEDFENGYASIPRPIMWFPMKSPLPPKGQMEVVPTRHRSRLHRRVDPREGNAVTVYGPLRNPRKPVLDN